MHEFGLAEGVLDAVLRRAAGRPVSRVRLRAGVRHRIDEAAMTHAFRLVAAGTGAEGALLDVVAVPARLTCRSCGRSVDTYDVFACCPGCAGAAVDVTGGDDLVLESLAYAAAAS